MAKPYDFTSPILTEKSLERIAYDIDQKYATQVSVKEAIGGVDLSSLETRVTSIEDDLDGLLVVMKEVI